MASAKMRKIVELLEEKKAEFYPLEISRRTGLNHSTVKNYCRKLLRDQKIAQPYRGVYCSKLTYSMVMRPAKVHNVILSVPAPWLRFSDDVTEFVSDVKIRVQFGKRRRRITGRISCDAGMDHRAALFSVERFYDIVHELTGRVVDEVVVKTFEINRDFQGLRLDGARSFTRTTFGEYLDRIYQKGKAVRSEIKISKEVSVDQMLLLAQGGIPSFQVAQSVFELSNRLSELLETMKFQNRMIQALVKEVEHLKGIVKNE